MTPAQLLELRALADGFRGTFEFKAECVDAEDFIVAEDALVYCTEDQDDYEIASPVEEHIGEPIAKMLNAVPALLDRVAELDAGLREAIKIARAAWTLYPDEVKPDRDVWPHLDALEALVTK